MTLTVPGGILSTATGPVAGVTNMAVTNLSGKSLLPPPSSAGKTMKVGYNLHVPSDLEINIAYANLMKSAEGWGGDTTKFTFDVSARAYHPQGLAAAACIASHATSPKSPDFSGLVRRS